MLEWMIELGPGMISIILFSSLVLALFLGLPLVFALGGVATLFVIFIWGPDAVAVLANATYKCMGMFMLVAVPMFIFMGAMLQRAGIADDMYNMMYHWMGALRGGLAAGTVLICTLFAAMVGISGAATVSMGLLALPSMLKRGYHKDIAIGSVSAGGALGILIPPSVLMIVLAQFARLSLGKLFMGGVFSGLLLAALFIGYILIRSYFQKDLAPGVPPEEILPWRQKFLLVPGLIMPIGLIFLVMGSIFMGFATPSEASAVGATGAILCAAVKRRLTWGNLVDALFTTLRLSAMVLWIVYAASVFTSLYAVTGAAEYIGGMIMAVPGGRWGALITMQLMFFVLGCLFDPIGIVMITTPIFFPVVRALGFDPLWFGVLYVVNMEMGFLTPPFGYNLFYMKGVVPPGITMGDIYRSIIPFVALQAVGLILCMIFPPIITWLPGMMIGKEVVI